MVDAWRFFSFLASGFRAYLACCQAKRITFGAMLIGLPVDVAIPGYQVEGGYAVSSLCAAV